MIRFQDGQNRIEMPEGVLVRDFRDIKPSTEITKTEAQDFWNDVFGEPKKRKELSFEDVVADVYGRDEEEFSFDIDINSEEIREALDNFRNEAWSELSEDDKCRVISDFAGVVGKVLDLSKIPKIDYFEGHPCDCGCYDPYDNEIWINKKILNDPQEIVDTVAHEMRHAFQYERANKLETYEDFLYAFNFANYIVPEETADGYVSFIDYQDQLIEAEARAFASMFVVEEVSNEQNYKRVL